MLDASYQLTICKQPELLAKGHTHCVTVGCHSARATFDVVLEAQLVRTWCCSRDHERVGSFN